MAIIQHDFFVDITPGARPQIIYVSEYDIGRQFSITLMSGDEVYSIPANTTATIEGTIADHGFTVDAYVASNKVYFDLTEDMTAVAGRAWTKIKLVNNDEPVSSCAFILAVDRAGVEAETVIGAPGFEEQIVDAVQDWLEEHPPAAGGMTEEIKQALLDCFEHVAWIDDQGQDYYDALYDALYPPVDVLSISAVFTQGDNVIYDTDSLDDLKQYLVVTATMTDSTTQTLEDTDYTLSGILEEGTSVITVSYGGKTTTFSVTVTEYNPLPSGYTKYDYIATAGSAYIQIQNTSDPPISIGDTIHTIALSSAYSSSVSKVACGGSTKDYYVGYAVYSSSENRAGAYYGAAIPTYDNFPSLYSGKTEFFTQFTSDGSVVTVTNGGTTKTITGEKGSATMQNTTTFRIGKSGATGSEFVGRIYLVEVRDTSDALKYQFIPCVRNSDSKAGMYDVIGETFYPSSSSTAFTAGND